MTISTDEILDAVKLGRELVTDFFVTFSRFEYALIRAGYIRPAAHVEPDWIRYIVDVEALPTPERQLVIASGAVLIARPPKRLVMSTLPNQGPEFKTPDTTGKTPERIAIEGLKRARNNLFHGGKGFTPVSEPDRNREVIECSLKLLVTLLSLSYPQLSTYYDERPQ